MPQVDRFSVALEPSLGAAVRRSAHEAGVSVSAWMSAAAADKVRNGLLRQAVDELERGLEGGPLTDDELDAARRRLGHGDA